MSNTFMQHLPKLIDESSDRNHYYETLWKRVGLGMLERIAGPLTNLSLLDYGCGRGETLDLATRMGMHVQGTDPDPECVALSSRFGHASLLVEPNYPATQFGTKSFDCVTCFHVLEHVDRPREVLSSLALIARKFIVLAVPNLRMLPRFRFLRKEPHSVNEGHLQGWDHAHLRNLAERHCGLKLIAWEHDHVRMPILSGLASLIGGNKLAVSLETRLFLKLFPFHSTSIIALLEVSEGRSEK